MTYKIKFERIGRKNKPDDLVINADNMGEEELRFYLEQKICDYVDRFLTSREFGVDVDLEEMKGSIEFGRYGNFKIEVANAK